MAIYELSRNRPHGCVAARRSTPKIARAEARDCKQTSARGSSRKILAHACSPQSSAHQADKTSFHAAQ